MHSALFALLAGRSSCSDPESGRISRGQRPSDLLGSHPAFRPLSARPSLLPFPTLLPLLAQIYGIGASNNVQRAILVANANQTPFELKVR